MTSISPESGRNPQKPARSSVVGVIGTDVRDAVDAWAKGILGAPRNLGDMVFLLKQEEDVIARVATEIHRREVVEQRGPPDRARTGSSPPLQPTGRRTDPRTVDPWTISPEDLRSVTEDVDTCLGCGGRGAMPCAACAGSGAARCTTCGGAPTPPGAAQCALCRGAGAMACGTCGGQRLVACGGCHGLGVQLVWLTYAQVTRIDVNLVPQSPLLALHAQLTEARILAESDLAPFTILAAAMAPGQIPSSALAYDDYERLQEKSPPIDARQERLIRQQYLRFAAIRRELAYEMCGTRARLVLSGANFAVETTDESRVPIHRRLVGWSTSSALFIILAGISGVLLFGPTSYFARANAMIAGLLALATLFVIVVAGGVMRVIGPRFKLGGFTLLDKIAAGGLLLSLGGIVAVKVHARPTSTEARELLASGNMARTELTIDAMEATNSEVSEIGALRDELAYATAQKLQGEERLTKLDQLAATGGTRSVAAADDARKERMQRVQALLAQRKTTDALDLLGKLFPATEQHGDIRELRATIHDAELEQCVTDPCRFIAARKAEHEASTLARTSRVKDLRVKLEGAVSASDIPGEPMLARLRRLRALEATVQSIVAVATADDGELVGRAKSAGKWAADQRAKVPLIGAEQDTLEELLGHLDEKMHVSIQGVAVYVSMDKSKRCSGIYVVGETREARKEGMKSEYLPALMLSKALGRPAALRKPEKDQTKTSWTEDGAPVVVRWRDGAFAELAVGDVASAPPPVKPRPLGPAKLPIASFVAFPGGEIFIDGVSAGRDSTAPMKLKIGKHEIKIKNRVLGETTEPFEIKDTDPTPNTITIVW